MILSEEAIALVVEIVVLTVLVVVGLVILRKCIWPVLKWSICPTQTHKQSISSLI